MPRPSQRSPIIAAKDTQKVTVASSPNNVFLLDLPVLGGIPYDCERKEGESNQEWAERFQEERLVIGGQCHYSAIIACHPCYACPMKYTTLHLINGSTLDIQIPYDQWHPFFQSLGVQFSKIAQQQEQSRIVTPAELRGGGL